MFADMLASVFNSLELPSFSHNSPAAWDALTQGTSSTAGVAVTHDTALSLAPVWQAVSMISGDVAGLTLNCYTRTAEDDREIDDDHPAQPLVSVEPNEETSANEFWRRLMAHALLYPGGYAYIERRGPKPVALYNLCPDRVKPERTKDGTLFYVAEVDGEMVGLRSGEVLHVKGLSLEAGAACDLVDYARDCIGMALAAEGFNARFFSQGCQVGGVLMIPPTYTEKAAANLEEGFRKRTSGQDNWFKVAILREGAKFSATTVNPENAQMHELREDQVRDVARFFNIPPAKLGILGSVSYNSAEMSQLDYMQSCLTHWLRAICAECGMKLLTRDERHKTHYFEHNTSNFLEVDTATLTDVLVQQRTAGFITGAEARRKLNLPKNNDPSLQGFGNPNTTPGKPAEQVRPSPEEVEEQTAPPSGVLLRPILTDVIGRMARRVTKDARAKKPDKLLALVDGKAQEHRGAFDDTLKATVGVIAAIKGEKAEALLTAIHGRFFTAFLEAVSPCLDVPQSELAEAVDKACAEFESTIAGAICEGVL